MLDRQNMVLHHKRGGVALLLVLMGLLLVSIGTISALFIKQTETIENEFTAKPANILILEEFDGDVKSNVAIQNTSEIPVYIRVALVPNWEDVDGNIMGISASMSDFTLTGYPGTGWVLGTDGYWYYTSPVTKGGQTSNLFDTAVVNAADHGYNMNLKVLAQCIQADGESSNGERPVEQVWSTGVVGVNEDGSLNIQQEE